MKSSFLALVSLAVSTCVEAIAYSRNANLYGQSFIDSFGWLAIGDPTNGRVNYVNKDTALALGLYTVSGNTVILRADDSTILTPNGPGRNSFRLQSNTQYNTHVAIFDIGHMPEGCGTWPAICELLELGANWPNGGEIDIVEGVNNQIPNLSSLHTSPNCFATSSVPMTGTLVSTDCDVYTTGNSGCGVRFNDPNSFGPYFNGAGGGWYAIERSNTDIKIFFWERGSSSVPNDVRNPGESIDTSTWGTPVADFSNASCDFPSHFSAMNIIINLTFCGDWAGNTYIANGCPGTCVDFVNNNPGAFSNAYFEFNALNIYV